MTIESKQPNGKFVKALLKEYGLDEDLDVIANEQLIYLRGIHPLHMSTALMNDMNALGTHRWQKCPNCGEPFDGLSTQTEYLCSDKCETEYIAYLNDPEAG
jgi:hypothetical protein